MLQIPKYLTKGWSILEDDLDDGGYVSYWLVTPLGSHFRSFPTQRQAYVYWREHRRALLAACVDNGQQLAEDCGLVWDELDTFEQRSWTRMSNKHYKEES